MSCSVGTQTGVNMVNQMNKLPRSLGRYVCEAFMADGDSAPLIIIATHWLDPTRDHMDLDKAICAAGLSALCGR